MDDSPRPGKMPAITAGAREWLVDLACQKPKHLGYPHERWTARLLASHAREHGPAAGHACLAGLVQGTVCKIRDINSAAPRRCLQALWHEAPRRQLTAQASGLR
ncbi:MAG: helix-turn-helix domain-containing protein [Beijerinckiaceae bacterium]